MDKEKEGKEEKLSRRAAIKRIAATFAGAVISTKVLGQTSQGFQLAYLSNPPYNPYADSVYASTSPSYDRYISYYTSYRSHYSSVPPPYFSSR